MDLTAIPSFYQNYVRQLQGASLNEAMELHQKTLIPLLSQLPDERWAYRYEPGKWSIKEMVQHIIDTERIFCYRALCFARGEKTPLPGFDENTYALLSEADRRSAAALLDELKNVQQSVVLLFRSFSDDQLERTGIANGNSVSVKNIGLITAGHALHHRNVLKERYSI